MAALVPIHVFCREEDFVLQTQFEDYIRTTRQVVVVRRNNETVSLEEPVDAYFVYRIHMDRTVDPWSGSGGAFRADTVNLVEGYKGIVTLVLVGDTAAKDWAMRIFTKDFVPKWMDIAHFFQVTSWKFQTTFKMVLLKNSAEERLNKQMEVTMTANEQQKEQIEPEQLKQLNKQITELSEKLKCKELECQDQRNKVEQLTAYVQTQSSWVEGKIKYLEQQIEQLNKRNAVLLYQEPQQPRQMNTIEEPYIQPQNSCW